MTEIEYPIAFGTGRASESWPMSFLTWNEFLKKKLTKLRRTEETMDQYDAMSKEQKDAVKNGPAYVGGEVTGGARKKDTVSSRWVGVLDADNAGSDDIFIVDVDLYMGNFAGFAHETHSSRPHKQKFRYIFPFNRGVEPDEYIAILRWIANQIGMDYMDKTSFQHERLMYLPSRSIDAPYSSQAWIGPPVDADAVLAEYAAAGKDWRDPADWPRHSSEDGRIITTRGGGKRKPISELGHDVVRAFCLAYEGQAGWEEALEKYIPGIYESRDLRNSSYARWAYTRGSGGAGVRIYDDGYLFSEHNSDPLSDGHCHNLFDVIRAHRFGDLDAGKSDKTNFTKLPSFEAMCELVVKDDQAKRQLRLLQQETWQEEFGDWEDEPSNTGRSEDFREENQKTDSLAWVDSLDRNHKTGQLMTNPKNIKAILLNDRRLKGRIYFDAFSRKRKRATRMPWPSGEGDLWTDDDDAGLRNYLSEVYGVKGEGVIEDALSEIVLLQTRHPVQEYLKGLEWDGLPRLDTWLIDYFGAEDTELNRAYARKTLVAAVARVFEPGCTFQYVLTLFSAAQGRGKSLTLAAIFGQEWFTDSLQDIEQKDAKEQLHSGKWCLEISEMSAARKADVNRLKQFLASSVDTFRPSYARYPRDFKRQCIFIATTNDEFFITDRTGGRRFWPISVKKICTPEERAGIPRDQIWAEAMVRYFEGEHLYLTPELEVQANAKQAEHTEDHTPLFMDDVLNELEQTVPEDWDTWTIEARTTYITDRGSTFFVDKGVRLRQRVCVREIVEEVLRQFDKLRLPKQLVRQITEGLEVTGTWRKLKGPQRCGPYGLVKNCFERVST